MNKLDKDYQALLQDILDNGIAKGDRTGTGTISVFGRQIRHNMKDGFPLLTTKKMPFKTITTELLWFLRGDTNIKYLVDNNCHIWNGDCYANYSKKAVNNELDNRDKLDYLIEPFGEVGRSTRMYLQEEFINKIKTDDEFANKWGELGPVYGKQWRKWREGKYTNELIVDGLDIPNGPTYWKEGIDQIANLINDLKTNPDSRRLMVNSWNVSELDQMVLPPCHYSFQVYTRELSHDERFEIYKNSNIGGRVLQNHITAINFKQFHFDETNIPTRAISLMFNMRSNDVPLGLPFNIASYGLLLEIIGKMVNMVPNEIIANLGDAHIYLNQIDGVKEQLTRTPMKLPNLIISDDVNFNSTIDGFLESCSKDSFKLDGYESHPSIKMPLSN